MLEPLPDGAPVRWSVAEPELALALLEMAAIRCRRSRR